MIEGIKLICNLLLGIVKFIGIVISPILISLLLWLLFFLIFKKKRFPKSSGKIRKTESILKRLFWDFPKQFWLDRFNRTPDSFNMFGVHIIAGEQGSGKTITLTYMLESIRKQYPKCIIRTNYNYIHEQESIKDWRQLCGNNNGVYGQVEVLDEVQNWFNSLASKDFPPEMLTEVTQQRKQRKVIFGTSQVFGRVAKPIREQTTYLYEPLTIFGCLTVVRLYKPTISADGLTDKKRLIKLFFFVHNQELRNVFDTYRKVENLVETGFKAEEQQIRNAEKSVLLPKDSGLRSKR